MVNTTPGGPTQAVQYNLRVASAIERSAEKAGAVLGPCISEYRSRLGASWRPEDLLSNLTGPLLSGLEQTRAIIQSTMEARWHDEPARIPMSIVNSLRRSAGTNYQTLISYALARYFAETGSVWFVCKPVPRELKEALTITFTGGVSLQAEEASATNDVTGSTGSEESLEAGVANDDAEDGIGHEDNSGPTRVQPDVDILLRNAAWNIALGGPEPVVLLSAKTSLVDRAGQAARWKQYFDLATHPCVHMSESDCAYRQFGVSMENASEYAILHSIVTANIYKYNFHDARYRIGELASGQTQSNTFMFDLKLTTRDDGIAITPPTWEQFPRIVTALEGISRKYGLPR